MLSILNFCLNNDKIYRFNYSKTKDTSIRSRFYPQYGPGARAAGLVDKVSATKKIDSSETNDFYIFLCS